MKDRLRRLKEAQLRYWLQPTQAKSQLGHLPDYIPQLSQVDASVLAIAIMSSQNRPLLLGAADRSFVLMSVIKPFVLLFLLHQYDVDSIFSRVGVEPSDQPFHSVTQLAADRGRPRNPMINSGAIALASLLPGQTPLERCTRLQQWLQENSGCQLTVDQKMLDSVRSLSNETNRSIAQLLYRSGYLDNIDLAIETYNRICCLSGTVLDLAKLGNLLALPHPELISDYQRVVNSIMLTCGLYEASSQYAIRIGLPIKSGVSGAVVAIVPGEGAIAVYSPPIDAIGNSVGGLFFLEQVVRDLKLSLFEVR